MVVREDSRLEDDTTVSSGDDLFGATDVSTTSNNNKEPENKEYYIEVDTEELVDTMVKSVVGGVATGIVMNGLMGDR
jgi:hypothetical protein